MTLREASEVLVAAHTRIDACGRLQIDLLGDRRKAPHHPYEEAWRTLRRRLGLLV